MPGIGVRSAWAERSVPTPDGGWQVQRFFVWGPVAFAGIGELPQQQQDRSIVIQLHKALLREIPEHLEDGMSPELTRLRCKLATWAHDLTELPRPQLPDILMRQAGRTGDNWRVLFAIAQLAGGRWPALVERAALNAVMSESKQTMVQRLLVSIRHIFDARESDTAVPWTTSRGRIPTKELIAALLSDEQEEWGTANRGRAITEYWLRDNLRHLLDPPATQQWEETPARGRHQAWGALSRIFADAIHKRMGAPPAGGYYFCIPLRLIRGIWGICGNPSKTKEIVRVWHLGERG